MLTAGRVGRPHGLDGSFYVTGPRPRLLEPGRTVTVGGKSLRISRRAGLESRPILVLEGVEDRSAAEALRGLEIQLPAGEAPDLGPEEWWAHELVGCAVFDGEHRVGTVRGLMELPSCEVLEVAREGRSEPLLVPMVRDAIRSMEVGEGRIDIDMGFLGEPWT